VNKADFLKKLEIELKIAKNSENTKKNYLRLNTQLIDYTKKDPGEISTDDVKVFIAENLSDKASSSIVMFLSAIKYAYLGILKKDITSDIKRPKRERVVPDVLTKKEIFSLLEALTNKKSRIMISLIYATGLKVSEVTNLKIDDLDFDDKIGKILDKTGKVKRTFNIPKFLAAKLRHRAEKQKAQGEIYLFPGQNKKKMSDRNVQKIVKKAAIKAGIKIDVQTQTLRHSFAVHLLEKDIDIKKIKKLLGHSDLSTTQIYRKVSTEKLNKIKSPLDSMMNR